jgi:ATP-dependent Zn protease
MNKRWRNVGLYILFSLLALVVHTFTILFFEPSPPVALWRRERLIDAAQKNQITKVVMNTERTKLDFTTQAGERIRVLLQPSDQALVDTLIKNNVEVIILPQNNGFSWPRMINDWVILLWVLGLVFLLLRRT